MAKANSERQLVIDRFKTINRKTNPELLDLYTGYTCQNLRYDESLGSLYKRPSRKKRNSTTLGTDPIKSSYRYYKNSNATKYHIISKSTLLQTVSDSTGAATDIKTSLTNGLRFKFITYKDMCYAINGTDTNQVFNGTACYDMGVPVPTAPSGVDSGAGSAPNGDYYYKVTYIIDSYQEGSASVASAKVTTVNHTITVTIPTSTNLRVTSRKIYRTKASGSIYYYLAEVADNTTTTYADSIPDASLPTDTAPTDYGVPGIYKYICLHKSRIFLAYNSTYKSRIIFSDIRSGTSYPDVFPALNYLDIAQDDGDVITGIFEDNLGNLVVSKENSIRIIHTDTDSPSGWVIGIPLTNLGCVAPYSIVKTPQGMPYIARLGNGKNRLMLWTGSGTKNICPEIDSYLDTVDVASLKDIICHYYNGKLYLSFMDSDEFGSEAIDSYTKLLLHCNGTDASTSFVDSSLGAKAVTANGNAQIDTAQSVFGGASGLFDGTTDYLSAADSDDWNFGTGDFSLDTRLRFNSVPGAGSVTLIGQLQDGNNHYELRWNTPNQLAFYNYKASAYTVSFYCTWIPVAATWYHIAVVRNGNTWYMFIDGVSQALTLDGGLYTGEVSSFTGNFAVGAENDGGQSLNGWLDEVRVSKGIARWTANFTLPTAEYGYGYNNKVILLDMDTQSMINVDLKNIDSFASWNGGTDVGELITGSSDTSGFIYEEEQDTSASETTIAITWKSGKLNFNQPRLRKRIRQARIDFYRVVASGTLYFYYALDGGSETEVAIDLATYYSQGYYIYLFPASTYCNVLEYRIYQADDIYALGIKKLTFIYNLEPLSTLF